MRKAAALFLVSLLACPPTESAIGQIPVESADTVSGDSYLTVHNVRSAHEITRGNGTKVGILDHSFGVEAHPELYAGEKRFTQDHPVPGVGRESYHGYWMALTLHEVAPKAEIYALNTRGPDEASEVEAIVRALDWAIQQGLDVVTYCSGPFSAAAQKRLDPAIERSVKAGVVVVFVDYPHPLNLLPSDFEPELVSGSRVPDLNIFGSDCTALLAQQFLTLVDQDDDGLQKRRPFLSHPSAGPVTAGMVALLKSVDQRQTPSEIKRVLMETSRPMVHRGWIAQRVPDAFLAVTNLMGAPPEVWGNDL